MESTPRPHQKRPRASAERRARKKRAWFILSTALLAVLAFFFVIAGITLFVLSRDLPDVGRMERYVPSQTTEIFSSDGVLLARLFDENREIIPLEDIAPVLRDATVAVEDHRFLEHRGMDARGILRALRTNVRRGGYAEGGSTITQQLVRGMFLTTDKRLSRKVKEAMLALRLERTYGKPRILAMYLNQVYYGHRSYGAEAASRLYFAKPSRDLTLAEAALLAGIPKNPAHYDPYSNRTAARQRRNVVLRRMAEAGVITPDRARTAMDQPVRLAYARPPRLTARKAHYFVDYVVRELENRYGVETVYHSGLKVQTTLNTRVQAAAEDAVLRHMARFGAQTEAALVAVDPVTGAIRAMVGGRDYRRSVFNRAVQAKRQPGSSFKPFVYAAAISAGHKPTDRILDAPIRFSVDDWRPRNYDGHWHGNVTLTDAFAQSINIPAIKLMDEVGADSVIQMARACGITSDLRPELSLALGSSEVTVLEMANAYGVFASGGDYVPATGILTVRDGAGRLLDSLAPAPQTVMDVTVARRMDYMLRQVVVRGTGRPVGAVPDARGKTGTTNSRKDAWFIGYTPTLATAVWIGNDIPTPIPGLSGGGACAPIWVSFMLRAARILPPRHTPEILRPVPKPPPIADDPGTAPPEERGRALEIVAMDGAAPPAPTDPDTVTVEVCRLSFQRPGPNCPEVGPERFPRGAEPTERCTLHDQREMGGAVEGDVVVVCRDSGGLAGLYCPGSRTVRLEPGARPPGLCTLHRAPKPAEGRASSEKRRP